MGVSACNAASTSARNSPLVNASTSPRTPTTTAAGSLLVITSSRFCPSDGHPAAPACWSDTGTTAPTRHYRQGADPAEQVEPRRRAESPPRRPPRSAGRRCEDLPRTARAGVAAAACGPSHPWPVRVRTRSRWDPRAPLDQDLHHGLPTALARTQAGPAGPTDQRRCETCTRSTVRGAGKAPGISLRNGFTHTKRERAQPTPHRFSSFEAARDRPWGLRTDSGAGHRAG
jgi:hypothetical protein